MLSITNLSPDRFPCMTFGRWWTTSSWRTPCLVYRLCLHANLMSPNLKRDEEVEIDTRMWVEDPISFAKCVDRKELTVMKHMVEKRVELMKNEDFPMWQDMLLQGKVIFVPINYPSNNHWIAGNYVQDIHESFIYNTFTNHSQDIHEPFTSHSRIIHRCHFVRQEGSPHYPTLRQFLWSCGET